MKRLMKQIFEVMVLDEAGEDSADGIDGVSLDGTAPLGQEVLRGNWLDIVVDNSRRVRLLPFWHGSVSCN